MGARTTFRTEAGESLELKEGVVLDENGRQLSGAASTSQRPHSFLLSLSGGNSLWILMLALFTPVLVIASFLAFGSIAAVIGVAWLGFAVIRGLTKLFS